MLDKKTVAIETVADHLGVSGWTVRTWIRSGLLSSHKIGRRVLLVEDEVRSLLSRTLRPAARPVEGNGHPAPAVVAPARTKAPARRGRKA